MVERGHGVESVSQACRTGLDGCYSLVVCGGGVAEGDFDVSCYEVRDEVLGALQLGRKSD